jgi:hypothetical protein
MRFRENRRPLRRNKFKENNEHSQAFALHLIEVLKNYRLDMRKFGSMLQDYSEGMNDPARQLGSQLSTGKITALKVSRDMVSMIVNNFNKDLQRMPDLRSDKVFNQILTVLEEAVDTYEVTIIVSKTFEIVTPESAEYGDAEERGFEFADVSYTENELERELSRGGYMYLSSSGKPNSSTWITTHEEVEDYGDGSTITYSLHYSNENGNDPEAEKVWSDLLSSYSR